MNDRFVRLCLNRRLPKKTPKERSRGGSEGHSSEALFPFCEYSKYKMECFENMLEVVGGGVAWTEFIREFPGRQRVVE